MLGRAFGTVTPEMIQAGLLRPLGERRSERRLPCDRIPARVQTHMGSIPTLVLDVSNSGMKLELPDFLPAGSEATVFFGNVVAAVRIRYCRCNRNGSFDAGMQIEDVITTALDG